MKLLNTSLTIALTAAIATAQWSDDPLSNLVISDATSDQVQPMIAPTADGGCYMPWPRIVADVEFRRRQVKGQFPCGGRTQLAGCL